MSRRRKPRFKMRGYRLHFSDVELRLVHAKNDRNVIDLALAKLRALKRILGREALKASVRVERDYGTPLFDLDENENVRPPQNWQPKPGGS